MKRFSILNALVLLFFAAQAQPKLVFGGQLGMNNSKVVHSEGYNNAYLEQVNYYNRLNDFIATNAAYRKVGNTSLQGGLRAGLQFGNGFWLMVEPTFFRMSPGYSLDQPVREKVSLNYYDPNKNALVEGLTNCVYNSVTNVTTVYETQSSNYAEPAIRNWKMTFNALKIPIMARFKVFGDRFGLMAGAGLSFNKIFSGAYQTSGVTAQGEDLSRDPLLQYSYQLTDSNTGEPLDCYELGKNQEYPTGEEISLGKNAFNHYRSSYTSVQLNPSLFFNVDEGGRIKIVLDWKWDLGLGDMYSKNRKAFLESNNNIDIKGSQKFNAGILQLGVEICPSCEF